MNEKICRKILHTLADCDGHPLKESVLKEHVDADIRPVPSTADFDDAILTLKSGGYIRAKEGDFGGEVKWLITEKGDTWLDR